MTELSLTPAERARNAHSRVLKAMEPPGTARKVAEVLGTSEATISRIKNEGLEGALVLVYQLGFKVVPGDHVCVERGAYEATVTIAARAMRNEQSARAILLGDDE